MVHVLVWIITDRSDIDLAIICPNATEAEWQMVVAIIDKADTLLRIDYIRFDTLASEDKLKSNIILDNLNLM